MLIELYRYETFGEKSRSFDEMKKTNGFAYGKWLRDIDVANIIEDVKSRLFCKAEFLDTALQRLHNKKFLNSIPAPKWFPNDYFDAKAFVAANQEK